MSINATDSVWREVRVYYDPKAARPAPAVKQAMKIRGAPKISHTIGTVEHDGSFRVKPHIPDGQATAYLGLLQQSFGDAAREHASRGKRGVLTAPLADFGQVSVVHLEAPELGPMAEED